MTAAVEGALERLDRRGVSALGLGTLAVAGALLLVVAPVVLPAFRLELLAKYLCYAIIGLGICLAWGKGGMLTLGQGVFFGLGGYAMGMHLKLAEAGPGGLPDFMTWSGVEQLPTLWKPFANPAFAVLAAVLLPGAVAFVLGMLVFRQRVRGAYFAILTQALAAAFVILLVGQQGLTGGTNGLTNFRQLFGLDLASPTVSRVLYLAVVIALGAAFLLVWLVDRSRFGRLLVAIRDGEDRVRFLGYDPALVKALVFAASAMLAGLAGALFVPLVGIISPAMLGVVPSITLVVAVALGGRASLAGAVIGAVLLNWAQTNFSEQFPSFWSYLQGALFVGVIVFLPRGVAGLTSTALERLRARRRPATTPGPVAVDPERVEEPA